jgi:CubicO group peptidase (beta-lactamase class C family)
MLYTLGRKDMAGYVAKYDFAHEPGTYWHYSSGDTNLLSAAFAQAIGPTRYHKFPWVELFNKLGMTSVTWETDQAGTYIGSSYLYATPRDLAKFGLLYLMDGVWENQRLLAPGWVAFSRTFAPAQINVEDREEMNYGAHWWINQGAAEAGISKAWPDAPDDTFAALGHWGQSIVIIPSQNMVLVRTANDRRYGEFSLNKFIALAIETFGQKTVGSPNE